MQIPLGRHDALLSGRACSRGSCHGGGVWGAVGSCGELWSLRWRLVLWGARELWHVIIARAVHSCAVRAGDVRFQVVAVGGSLDVACLCSTVDTVHRLYCARRAASRRSMQAM